MLRICFLLLNEAIQIFNRSGTLVYNKLVDHSDAIGALPVGAIPTTSPSKTAARRARNIYVFLIWCTFYKMFDDMSALANVMAWH